MKYLEKLNLNIDGYDKFNNFLLLESLIMESNIVYSSKFRLALTKCKNKISDKLLEIENKDINTPSNYFDLVPKENDLVSFTPDRKAREILDDKTIRVRYIGKKGGWLTNNVESNKILFDKLGYTPDGETPYKPSNTEVGEVKGTVISEESGKTFVYVQFEKGKGVYNQKVLSNLSDDKIKVIFSKNRQQIKVGRISRILLNCAGVPDVPDREIEVFVNSFKAIIDIMNDKFSLFDIVSGDDLGFWYHQKNYFRRTGSLGSSCQAVGRLDWLDFYIKNPQTVRLLILRSEEDFDKIVGRALLWNLDDGRILMDYIYSARESDYILFKEYAEENKWLIRDNISYNELLCAYIKPQKYRSWPSVDTMRYWDPKTGKICNKMFTTDSGERSTEIYWRNEDDPDYDHVD